MLSKRFNPTDAAKWQNQANIECGGNLTLWIEKTLNNEIYDKEMKAQMWALHKKDKK